LHCPWQHPAAVDFLADVRRWFKPKAVVCLGDEIDAMAFSRYGRDPDAPGEAEELRQAVAALRPIYKLFPRVKVCESNHTLRLYRKANRSLLPSGLLRAARDILGAPRRWHWAARWEIDGVQYLHGDGFSGFDAARKAATQLRAPTVIGHVHTAAGVWWSASPLDRIWGMSAGCLIDPSAIAFRYAAYSLQRPVLGVGLIEDGVPRFYPLVTGKEDVTSIAA